MVLATDHRKRCQFCFSNDFRILSVHWSSCRSIISVYRSIIFYNAVHTKTTASNTMKPNGSLGGGDGETANANTYATSSKQKPQRRRFVWIFLRLLLRWTCIDLPLAATFGAYTALYGLQELYQTYYAPLIDRSTRSNEDLKEQFTYYHRRCTAQDVSTTNLTDLIVPSSTSTSSSGVDILMKHGLAVIPNVLQPETVQQLRAYADHRNQAVRPDEEFPLSQGHQRISFGYDATEHPAVADAIQQVAHHPILQPILQQVLGDIDPASTEITTISQSYGAPPQAWHSDTKEEGNALKFARTYSHSYSLFLPLQDTTGAMGPTDVCPGTHYCANDLSQVCEHDGIGQGLHMAYPNRIFQAGDAALLNQHVWHRGAAHRARDEPDRVVLILSFIARPRWLEEGDTRQLGRGTYFHQKWNNWGHTVEDMKEPYKYMQAPWPYLKCLGLWNRAGRHWGYDLITATFMRFANEQLDGEISGKLWPQLDRWKIPTWLRGENMEDFYLEEEDRFVPQKAAWQILIEGTLERVTDFVAYVGLQLHGIYAVGLVFCCGMMWVQNRAVGRQAFVRSVMRLIKSHGLIWVAMLVMLQRLRMSQWGDAILNDRALMQPFPSADSPLLPEESRTMSSGPTTFPSSLDFLVGTRFDAPWLGAYNDWLQGHPGNNNLHKLIDPYTKLFQHNCLGSRRRPLCLDILEQVYSKFDGRFLQQDYHTGDWRVQSPDEAHISLNVEFLRLSSPIHAALLAALEREMAYYRFETSLRTTALARRAAVYAWKLKFEILFNMIVPEDDLPKKAKGIKPLRTSLVPEQQLSPVPNTSSRIRGLGGLSRQNFQLPSSMQSQFRKGVPVWMQPLDEDEEELWYRADILEADDESVTVALESGEILDMPMDTLALYRPPSEGDTAWGCFSPLYPEEVDEGEAPVMLEDCWEGRIERVFPDGAASISYFEDGDFDHRKPPGQYFLAPFKYALPDGY